MGEWMHWGGGSAVRELGNLHSEGWGPPIPPPARWALSVSLDLGFFLLTISGFT